MNILFTAPPYVGLAGDKGGVYQLMRYYARSLGLLGHSVTYLNPWGEPDWGRYDLCHLFNANGDSYTLGQKIAKKMPLVVSPVIDHIDHPFYLRMGVLFNRLFQPAYTHVGRCAELCALGDLNILMSKHEKDRVEKGLGVCGKSWVALSPVFVEENGKNAPPPSNEVKRVLFLGDMGNRRKNIFRLLEAAADVECQVLLAGRLPQGAEGAKLREACNTMGNVEILGPVSNREKWDLLKNCDVFVLPSTREGIGLAAIEAGLLGRTVVITENGGAYDYLEEEAYYVNPLRVESIRAGLLRALRNPKNPSEFLRRRLDPRSLGQRLVEGYEAVLEKKSRK